MQTQEAKRIGRQLRELYSLLKQEILDEGIDLLSPEYDTLLKIGQDKIREIVLARAGFTLEEYREAKARIESEKSQPIQELKAEVEVIKQAPQVKVPTSEEIADIAKGVIPAPQVIQNVTQKTINKIVRETIVEKPTVIRETVVKNTVEKADTSELEQRVAGLVERLDALPENNFAEHFEKNIDVNNMPDFRKLAMGLQGQIDELRDAPGGSGAVDSVNGQTGVVVLDAGDVGADPAGSAATAESNANNYTDTAIAALTLGYTKETPSGTLDGSNVTFTVTAVPVYIVVDGITLFEGAGYTISTLTLTLDNAPQQFIRSFY